jgi:hypothetical protein
MTKSRRTSQCTSPPFDPSYKIKALNKLVLQSQTIHQTGHAPVIDNAGALVIAIYVPSVSQSQTMYQARAVITDNVQTWCPATHKQSTKLVLQLQTRYQAAVASHRQFLPSWCCCSHRQCTIDLSREQEKTPRGHVWDQLEDSSSLKLKLLIIVCVVTSS